MTLSAASLNKKFTLATMAGFVASSLLFLGLFFAFYENELEQQRAQAATDVNRLLQSSLENAMLKRDLEGLASIVESLGQQQNIAGVMIANPLGLVRFSSHAHRLGVLLDRTRLDGSTPRTHFMDDESGTEVLRSINPVRNKPRCEECHGTMENNPVNGILVVDYDATSIRSKARNTTLMLMGAGALIVILNLIGGWWFIRRFILQPVERLSSASQALAKGELGRRVALAGGDELAKLGETFNEMAANLQASMREQQQGRQFLQAMVDAIPDGLRIIDNDYNMLLVNRAFREQSGCVDRSWVGEKCYTAAHNRDAPCPAELMSCPLEEIGSNGRPLKLIHQHQRCDGGALDVEICAAPIVTTKDGKQSTLIVESIRDLAAEVRFTHEQRLSELGRLAAGVAHEIYNPLSSMKLALHSIAQRVGQQDQTGVIREYLELAEEEMEQCITITDRLLRLSAAPSGQLQLVDMRVATEETLSLVKWEAEESAIEIMLSFPDQPLRVFATEGELRMLILNLVQNAFHAMPGGGRLKITASIEHNDVVMRFEDTGVGIPDDVIERIFAPFFSRRADGVHGTGLGLPISRSIVESFNGSLEVESKVGAGSCFIVRIPQASEEGLIS